MKIKKLELTGMRAFTQAEFDFLPGMNLLVGVNGVGKTTVLDALRICLSRVLPDITSYPSPKQAFEMGDISIGSQTLQISCDFELESQSFNLFQTKQRESVLENKPGSPRESVIEVKDIEKVVPPLQELLPKGKGLNTKYLGVYFSTKRSIITDKAVSGHATAGGIAAAFTESLSANREFNLRLFAQWYKVQEELGPERPIGLKHIAVLREAVELFLPGFKNLRVEKKEEKFLFMIDKNGTSLNLNQLSDGERGVLSMVLDLARRLSQANPTLQNPLFEGAAIVMIDEIELHLHPKWQLEVIEKLRLIFPNVQFFITTHSPFIIQTARQGEVIMLGSDLLVDPYGKSLEEIARYVMDIHDTEYSPRIKKMGEIAKHYLLLVQESKAATKERKDEIQKQIIKLLAPFSDNPAYTALLESKGLL